MSSALYKLSVTITGQGVGVGVTVGVAVGVTVGVGVGAMTASIARIMLSLVKLPSDAQMVIEYFPG